jgi:D-alanyl-lipoteichoic acid acyltransferase DltB (MBOAT superfamily)
MVFTSFHFVFFFAVLFALHQATPAKYRPLLLLAASYFFYVNIKPVFAVLLAGVTVVTYFSALAIGRCGHAGRRRRLLQGAIVLIILPLFFFKYFAALNTALAGLLAQAGVTWVLPEMNLLLPVGISFYTFMALGYVIDVYYEEVEVETELATLGLFIAFFPLILSGPIERAGNMLPQFKARQALTFEQVSQGCRMMLWGYFLKIVVADRVGMYVDAVYGNVAQHNGTTLLFASALYPFQIYADLGGYSLLAIGASRILGYDVMPNFKRPFFATSMSEFWRRWHMSLISWVNDYIYTPLSFALRGFKVWGIIASLLVTFVISGIWHGATLTFVVWGLLQGMFLSIEVLLAPRRAALEKRYQLARKTPWLMLMMALTFAMFATSMVFSRAASIADALGIYRKIFSSHGPLFIDKPSTMVYIACGILVMLAKDVADEFMPQRWRLLSSPHAATRTATYSTCLIAIVCFGVIDGGQFIYFQF